MYICIDTYIYMSINIYVYIFKCIYVGGKCLRLNRGRSSVDIMKG